MGRFREGRGTGRSLQKGGRGGPTLETRLACRPVQTRLSTPT